MNFRRWMTALAVLALFAGFASAQVSTGANGAGPFVCNANVSVTPSLRAEGLTELAGDIVLTCTGGSAPGAGGWPALGQPLPTANIVVSFGTNVTSRLLTYLAATPSAVTAANTSEALLMIDEPGSGLTPGGVIGGVGTAATGWGPQAAQLLCGAGGVPYSLVGAGVGGCQQSAQQLSNGDYVMSTTVGSVTTTPAAADNMFSGVVNANQVTFYGIPIMPPVSNNVARVYRMNNIRINANGLAGGGLNGTTQVLASISISPNPGVTINQPVQIAGFVQAGLSTSLRNIGNTGSLTAPTFNQCNSTTVGAIGILRYSENFGTAFKTRVAPLSAGAGAGQAQNLTGQNIPGTIYNSESGFIYSGISGVSNSSVAGLADYGTRLKAQFNNVPSGVRIFVSTTNIVNLTGAGAVTPPVGNSSASFAQLVLSDTSIDSTGAPIVPAAGFTTPPNSVTQLIGYAEIPVVSGSATAVWEVINTNPATPENFDFGMWTTYVAATATNSPTPGTATVNMSFAPVPPTFTASAGATASGSLTIPRFADTSSAASLFGIAQCSTSLLFPFITNQAGFDTGIAIMNTTTDPFGTKPQAGTCALNFYGQNAPPVVTTASIASGNPDPSKYAFLASTVAPNFEGYMIAVCNFQLAHGYAFISDLGARNLAHGYLALVLTITNPLTTSGRTGNPEQLEN